LDKAVGCSDLWVAEQPFVESAAVPENLNCSCRSKKRRVCLPPHVV
jgi:hypothetical protein